MQSCSMHGNDDAMPIKILLSAKKKLATFKKPSARLLCGHHHVGRLAVSVPLLYTYSDPTLMCTFPYKKRLGYLDMQCSITSARICLFVNRPLTITLKKRTLVATKQSNLPLYICKVHHILTVIYHAFTILFLEIICACQICRKKLRKV